MLVFYCQIYVVNFFSLYSISFSYSIVSTHCFCFCCFFKDLEQNLFSKIIPDAKFEALLISQLALFLFLLYNSMNYKHLQFLIMIIYNHYLYIYRLLPHHLEVSSLYFLLTALMLGQPVKHLPADTKFSLSTLWEFLWGLSLATQPVSSVASKVNISPEATVCLLGMVKSVVHSDPSNLPEWLLDYPVAIIQVNDILYCLYTNVYIIYSNIHISIFFQVLFSLYHNLPDFMLIVMSVEVINVMAAILFPTPLSNSNSERSSGASTPHDESGNSDTPIHVQAIDKSQPLTEHPVRKFVMDFFRVIIVDSLTLAVTGKSAPVMFKFKLHLNIFLI